MVKILENGYVFAFLYTIFHQPDRGSGQDVLQDRDALSWLRSHQ